MTSVRGVSTGSRVQDVTTEAHGLRFGAWSPVLISVVVTAVGAVLWVTVFPRVGTDLSAQIARAGWASRYPGSAYLFNWYGGVYPASYALLTPYLLAVVGVRLGTAVAAIIAAGLLGLLLSRHQVPHSRAAAVWAGVVLCTQFTAGRSAFTLGVAAGLGCLAALALRQAWVRLLAVGLLAPLTSAFSPVAGLFLGIAAAVLLLTGRRIDGLVIGVGAALPIALMTALFRDGGVQPIGYQNAVPAVLSAAGVLVFVPRRWRLVRLGALIYALVVITVWTVPTPIGSNVERLGELLIGPLLAGMAGLTPPWSAGGSRLGSRRSATPTAGGAAGFPWRIPVALALTAAATWQLIQPITDLSHGNGPMYVPQTAALISELRTLHAGTARVEAVPQYGHWESQQLASVVWLARGWERQVDVTRNPLFYGGTLSPAAYYSWLRSNAVRYVAISAAIPDFAATAEADVIRFGGPWLVPVWRDSFWTLYRVAGTLPLASPPATVTATTPAQITVRLSRAGTTIVRVRWSPWLRVSGNATVAQHGEWTSLTVPRAGSYTMSAPY
ncbi:MAG TPA: hypothetical protein VGS62_10620 [Streptosporangiaceae bacterium]|nr:hypothetical protein [Streptosporangiaceae bacterium]